MSRLGRSNPIRTRAALALKPKASLGTELYSHHFTSDTPGSPPAGFTVESGSSWIVASNPFGHGPHVGGITNAVSDDYLRKDFTRQTAGTVVFQHTLISGTSAATSARTGSIIFYDSNEDYAFGFIPISGIWAVNNTSGLNSSFGSWGTTGLYNIVIPVNLDTKTFRVQINGTLYDNAGSPFPMSTGTVGIAKFRASVFSTTAAGTFYFDNVTGHAYQAPVTPPSTTGTLSSVGTFDGVTLGADKYGRVVLGYDNADPLIANIKLERSSDNSNWTDVSSTSALITSTGSGRWTVIDRRPQFGTQSVVYGGQTYYRVSGYNSGGATPVSSSGAITHDVNQTAFETTRFTNASAFMAGSHVAGSSATEAYAVYWFVAMVYAYYRTGNSTYLTDAQNQFTHLVSLTHASGIFQMTDYTTLLYRDHHWRTVYHTAVASRLMRRMGQNTFANTLIAQADTWANAFWGLNSGAPTTAITRSGWDNTNVSTANVQLVWAASTVYAVGDIVRPTAGTPARTYRITVGGNSGGVQPTWPNTNAGSVSLNGVTYVETTVSGVTSYATYSTTAPYTGSAAENNIDMNQNLEEAATLALMTTDPNSAYWTAGTNRTKAINHITDTMNVMSAYQTSTGAIPIGDTWGAANGPGGYDTVYGAYSLYLLAMVWKYTPSLAGQWTDEMITKGLTWMTTNYGTEPITGVHYFGGFHATYDEIANRAPAYKIWNVTNPVLKLRHSAAVHDAATDRQGDYNSNGAVTPVGTVLQARVFSADTGIALVEPFTWNASATIAATSSTTITAQRTAGGSATIAATSGTTITGMVVRNAQASSAGASNATINANVTVTGSATIAATSGTTVTGRLELRGSATVAALSSVTATAQNLANASATIAATSAVTCATSVQKFASASSAGTSSATIAGVAVYSASVSSAGVSTATISGAVPREGSATIAATSTVTATAFNELRGSVTSNALSTVTVIGSGTVSASATINATSGASITGMRVVHGSLNAEDTLAFDSMTDATNTLLHNHISDNGHVPVRHGTNPFGANAQITAAGRARRSAASITGVLYYYPADPGVDDYFVRATMYRRTNTTTFTGIAARIHATNNDCYIGRWNRDASPGNSWQIVELIGGATTNTATGTADAIALDDPREMELYVGPGIQELRVDGVLVCSSAFTGITARGFGGVRFADNGGTDGSGTHLDDFALVVPGVKAVSNVTAAGSLQQLGSATIAATSSATASAVATYSASATVAATSNATIIASRTVAGSATIAATSGATISAQRTAGGTATIAATSNATINTSVQRFASATIAAQSSIAISTQGEVLGIVTINAASGLNAQAVRQALGSVTVAATSGATVTASRTTHATASSVGASDVTISGQVTRLGSITAASTSSVAAEATSSGNAEATINATSNVIVAAMRVAMGVATSSAQSNAVATGTLTLSASSTINAQTNVLVLGSFIREGSVTINAVSNLRIVQTFLFESVRIHAYSSVTVSVPQTIYAWRTDLGGLSNVLVRARSGPDADIKATSDVLANGMIINPDRGRVIATPGGRSGVRGSHAISGRL